jgi:hypothetical protein
MWDPAFRKCATSAKLLYIVLYLSAVEARSEQLPDIFDADALHDRSGLDTRTVQTALAKLQEVGLIGIDDKKRITVHKVGSNHEKLHGFQIVNDSPYGADKGPSTIQYRKNHSTENKKSGW